MTCETCDDLYFVYCRLCNGNGCPDCHYNGEVPCEDCQEVCCPDA